jgi:hypothetical protein
VKPRARRSVAHIFRPRKHRLQRRDVMRRHEDILDLDAVRAARPHAQRLIAAPIVEDVQFVARHCGAERFRSGACHRQERAADEMRRVGNAGAIVPFAGEPVTTFDWGQRAHRRNAMRSSEVSVGAE